MLLSVADDFLLTKGKSEGDILGSLFIYVQMTMSKKKEAVDQQWLFFTDCYPIV